MTLDRSPQALAALFADLGRELSGADGAEAAFAGVCRAAVRRMPGVDWASVTTGREGAFSTISATDENARAADRIQYELGTGPCIDAARYEAVYCAEDLTIEQRWPEFSRRAAAMGVRSMLSFRLFTEDDDVIAALNLYATHPDVFDADARAVGTLLATHGARAVAAATGRENAAHLERGLLNRREIGVAMGVLMTRHKITRDQAFDLLRIASQHTNRKIAEIATEVADTGTLAVPPLAGR